MTQVQINSANQEIETFVQGFQKKYPQYENEEIIDLFVSFFIKDEDYLAEEELQYVEDTYDISEEIGLNEETFLKEFKKRYGV